MDTYKINISNDAKESLKRTQNLLSAIDNSVYSESAKIGNILSSFSKAMCDALPDIQLINETLRYSLDNIAKIISPYNYTDTFDGMTQMAKELFATLSNMQIEQLKALSQIDFRKFNFDFHTIEFDDLVDLAYEATMEDTEDVTISKEELKETFIAAQREGNIWKRINTQLYDSVEKFKKTHLIFCIIMTILIEHAFFPWFDEAIGKHVIPKATSIVRELPEKSSEIICHLEQNIEAIILENQNYYYKVSFIDENGIEREGYIAKRNLKMIDKEEDINEQPTVSGNNPAPNNN